VPVLGRSVDQIRNGLGRNEPPAPSRDAGPLPRPHFWAAFPATRATTSDADPDQRAWRLPRRCTHTASQGVSRLGLASPAAEMSRAPKRWHSGQQFDGCSPRTPRGIHARPCPVLDPGNIGPSRINEGAGKLVGDETLETKGEMHGVLGNLREQSDPSVGSRRAPRTHGRWDFRCPRSAVHRSRPAYVLQRTDHDGVFRTSFHS
jgi:hypothetical protein